MKRVAIGCSLFVGVLALSATLVHAQIVNITHTGGSPYATIQQAVDNVNTVNGDTITIGPGTINELPVPTVNKRLTFIGSGTPEITSLIMAESPIRFQGFSLPELTVQPPAKIQEGVDAISSSGSLNVDPGTYTEHVVISKPMNLIGSGTTNPTIDGSGTGNCVTVIGEFVRVKNVILTNAVHGLSVNAVNCQLRFITIHDNTGSGMLLTSSDYNLIHSNYIFNHGGSNAGIEMVGCRNNTVTGNIIHDNGFNIRITGAVYRSSFGNIIQGNTLLDPGTFSIQVASGAGTTKVDFNVFKTTVGGDKFVSNTSVPAETLKARHNWFQGHDGPGGVAHPTDFQGIVDSSGWFDASNNTRISVEPLNYQMVNQDAGFFSVMAMVPDVRQVRATRVTLTWNDTIVIMEDNEIPGAFFKNKMTVAQSETTTYTPANPTNTITVFDTLRGAPGGVGGSAGVPYVGTLFIMKFKGVSDGLSALTLSGLDIRDENFQPVPQVENWGPGSIVIGGSAPSGLNFDTKVFLQGAYNGTGLDTTLRHSALLPLSQPYNAAPWSYTGTENVDPLVGPPEGAVDWVLVELRTGTAANTKFASSAGWLMTDGSIKALIGLSPIGFSGVDPGNYYVVVRHRNHLAIMTAAAVAISSATPNYDFTTGQEQAFGTTPMIQVGSVFCMVSGDANGDGQVNATDRTLAFDSRNLLGYRAADLSLDGQVNATDRTIAFDRRNRVTQVP